MDKYFSAEAKSLIKESRLSAIDLGYDYISSFHFFLADCKLSDKYSIREFAFKTEREFHKYYELSRIGESTILAESLPLTKDAEAIIHLANHLRYYYYDTEVRPYHLFLAASRHSKSFFFTILKTTDNVQARLEQYYIGIGQLHLDNIHRNFFKRALTKLLRP